MKEEEKNKSIQKEEDNDIVYEEFENEVTTEHEHRSGITKKKKVKEKNYLAYVKSPIAKPLIIPKFPSLKIIGDNNTISKNIDKNMINANNEVIAQNFKMPSFPFLALRTERKPLDSKIYLVSVKISGKEPSALTVSKININFALAKLNKDISSIFKFSKIIPRISPLETTGDNITIRKNINKNVISEASIQAFKVQNFPLLALHVERKSLDSQIYLVSVKILGEEQSSYTIPKIHANVPMLVKLNKDVLSFFEFSKPIRKIPSILKSNIFVKLLDKQNYLMTIEGPSKKLNIPNLSKADSDFTLVKLNKGVNMVPENEVKNTLPLATMKISIKSSDKTIFIEPLLKTENKEIPIKDTKNNKVVITTEVPNLPSSILTMLFESDDKKYSIEGLLEVKPERPVIIVAIKSPNKDDYDGTLESILREIYRIKVGGSHIDRYIGTIADKKFAEDEPIRQGFIKVVDDSKSDILNPNSIDYDKLRDRLIELSGQGLSFLVFYINEDKKDSLLANLSSLREKIAPEKIMVIKPHKLSAEQKRELARAAWGFVDPEELSDNAASLDREFKLREEGFNNILEKIVSERKYAEIVKEGNEVDLEEGGKGSESPLHYQLKVFVVRYLIQKEKVPEEYIKTEYELQGGKIIPDVYVESKKLAIEVETFYGTGITPWRKLERTVEKYINKKVANEVWIVIPPLQTMLYLKDLVSKIKDLKEKGYDNLVKFYTVDLSKKELIPIEELPKKLSELFPKLL